MSPSRLRARDDFPRDVADALAFIAAHDVVGYCEAVESVVASFETREQYLEDVPSPTRRSSSRRSRGAVDIDEPLPASPTLPRLISPCRPARSSGGTRP